MKRSMGLAARVVAGTCVVALSAMSQYTISARPGIINSIEGTAYVNGTHVTDAKAAQKMFLSANDTFSTDTGKAEVLLTPGVFLRVGDHSEVRMISASLTDMQIAVAKGEAMIEVMDLLKENTLRVKVGDSLTRIDKIGLYRFAADNPPSVAVFEGKASVSLGDKKVDLGKGRRTVVDAQLKSEKFKGKDKAAQGDLYAWSKTRDEYASASSYNAAKSLASRSSGGAWSGYGFSGFNGYSGPGWFFNPAFGSYAWMPGDGAFFSPFGYGYFAPGYVNYAPLIYSSLGGVRGSGGGVAVPVNPNHLPVATTSGHRPTVVTPAGTPYKGSPAAGVMSNARMGPGAGHVPGGAISAARTAPAGGAAQGGGYGAAGAGRSAGPSGRPAGPSGRPAGPSGRPAGPSGMAGAGPRMGAPAGGPSHK
jgi:hypothetical protein